MDGKDKSEVDRELEGEASFLSELLGEPEEPEKPREGKPSEAEDAAAVAGEVGAE